MQARELFENTMGWLREHYHEHRFYTERDVVWTVQLRLLHEIENGELPLRVFNDYTISKGVRSDLVIMNGDVVEVAIDFKYEPSHSRSTKRGGDIPASKLDPSVVFWRDNSGSVLKDVERCADYVAQGKAEVAYAVFIDEGGEFAHRAPPEGAEWRDWGAGRRVLWFRAPSLR